jgi:hypothetical protein
MVRYRTKLGQNQSLSWNKKLRQQQNHFLVQILRDLFNLKDQIKKRTNLALWRLLINLREPDDFGSKGEG